MPKGQSQARAWQRMLSGRRLDILSPSPMDIEISDIAHGLARVARWNGQTKGPFAYSVAQHSVLVERLVQANAPTLDQKWRLATLLHDGPEYVIGDMITPFKAVLGNKYKEIEAGLEAAIHLRFGLPAHLPAYVKAIIKRADRMAAWLEATQPAGFTETDAKKLFPQPRGLPASLKITPQSAEDAAHEFLRRFEILGGYSARQ